MNLLRASSQLPFDPVALSYYKDWQAGRTAPVTLLTASILFWLLPELAKKKRSEWEVCGGWHSPASEPFQLICNILIKKNGKKYAEIIAAKLSLAFQQRCYKEYITSLWDKMFWHVHFLFVFLPFTYCLWPQHRQTESQFLRRKGRGSEHLFFQSLFWIEKCRRWKDALHNCMLL